jgi:iron complex transport system substrate-binding protein
LFTQLNVILLISIILCYMFQAVSADITVTDDAGNQISLKQPASRIVSLAPNLTELLFSAGAGQSIVATVSHSDYPLAARDIPQLGDAHNVDIEAIIALMPDLVVSWQTGNNTALYNKLTGLGLNVYQSEPDTLEKIGSSLVRFGQLTGKESFANPGSRRFLDEISDLRQQYAHKDKLKVFYQFWDRPIFTVNGTHLISRIIELCGGENIYSDLKTLTPQISIEAVLQSDPAIIIASGSDDDRPAWLDAWKLWPDLTAGRNNQLYFVPPDILQRHTTRISRGARMVCEFIDKARASS